MAPKKASASNGDGADAGGKFAWEGPNDTKLLLLTQGRYVKTDEYEQLSSVFPGTTVGSIRNRISALRVKQRNMYEELGWKLPEGAAGQSAKKGRNQGVNGKKREMSDDGGMLDSPSKKPKVKKFKEVVQEEDGGGYELGNGVVKMEAVEAEDEEF